MSQATVTIEPLTRPSSADDIRGLALLLVDAVDSGAAVSFLAPLSIASAEHWWRQTLTGGSARAIFVVARDAQGIVGTVQMHPAWAPNQPFRGEIAKLIVHRRGRGRGIGRQLMLSVQAQAHEAGFRLLTLDAKRGAAAERLYSQLGWIHVGIIPGFALDTDGVTLHDDSIYYLPLDTNSSYQLLPKTPAHPTEGRPLAT